MSTIPHLWLAHQVVGIHPLLLALPTMAHHVAMALWHALPHPLPTPLLPTIHMTKPNLLTTVVPDHVLLLLVVPTLDLPTLQLVLRVVGLVLLLDGFAGRPPPFLPCPPSCPPAPLFSSSCRAPGTCDCRLPLTGLNHYGRLERTAHGGLVVDPCPHPSERSKSALRCEHASALWSFARMVIQCMGS